MKEIEYKSQRCFPFIMRRLKKHKLDFPLLYKAFSMASKEQKRYCGFVRFSEAESEEYKLFIEKHLQVGKPRDAGPRWVTTHNGGKSVCFFEDGVWKGNYGDGSVKPLDSIVVRYQAYKDV